MSNASRFNQRGIRVSSYGDVERFVIAFARGDLNLLILLGSHGLGKTRVVRQATASQACWLQGNTSPFGLYCQLWRNQNRPVVAIITNEWKTLNRNVAALQDRGHLVIFEPTALEVHLRTAEWFWDQEIFDFIGARLHLLVEPSMRHYLAAWELKQAGIDWRSLVLSRCLSGKALLVAQLQASPEYASEAERVRAFIASGGGSRATYFNLSKKLHAQAVTAPSIRLKSPPPPRRAADEALQAILRKWRGHFGDN